MRYNTVYLQLLYQNKTIIMRKLSLHITNTTNILVMWLNRITCNNVLNQTFTPNKIRNSIQLPPKRNKRRRLEIITTHSRKSMGITFLPFIKTYLNFVTPISSILWFDMTCHMYIFCH
eukprot:m.76420 g.76420  ORF g.76420 m.76420 type:complete len:118 (-) comp8515_c1_seq1:3887-4240(-)